MGQDFNQKNQTTQSDAKRRWLDTISQDDAPEKSWKLDDVDISVMPPDFEPRGANHLNVPALPKNWLATFIERARQRLQL